MVNLDTDAVPRENQKGTAFTGTVTEPDPNNPGQFLIVDLTDANPDTCVIEFRRPDGSQFTVPATVFGNPVDGQLRSVDSSGILNEIGVEWWIRASAGLNDGSFYPGSWTPMPVGS